MSLARLTDDYAHDGRVLFEVLTREALPDSLRDNQDLLSRLAAAYKQIYALVGKLGLKTLRGISHLPSRATTRLTSHSRTRSWILPSVGTRSLRR